MRTIFLSLFLGVSVANARVGETTEQCVKRYGTPLRVDQQKEIMGFKKNGILIMAYFNHGVCNCISFQKEERNEAGEAKAFTPVEVESLQTANGGPQKWDFDLIYPSGVFLRHTHDKKIYLAWFEETQIVKIGTAAFFEQEKINQDAVERNKMKGF